MLLDVVEHTETAAEQIRQSRYDRLRLQLFGVLSLRNARGEAAASPAAELARLFVAIGEW